MSRDASSANGFYELASALRPYHDVAGTVARWTVERPVPTAEGWFSPLDAIDVWAPAAVRDFVPRDGIRDIRADRDLSGSYLDELDGGISWDDPGGVIAAAWHDRDAAAVAVPAGVETLELEYEPEADDRERGARLLSATGGRDNDPFPASEVSIDWAGFFGSSTGVVFGKTLGAVRRGVQSARIRVAGRSGLVAARALHWAGRRVYIAEDPAFHSRLKADEEEAPTVANGILRLDTGHAPAAGEHCVVLVHGTVSTGIRVGRPLHPRIVGQVRRFEHDTFAPVMTNAADLVELVSERVESERLTLVAHSRGGLVARAAADRLQGTGRFRDVLVVTAGTPHEGTAMVTAAATGGFIYMLGENLKNQHSVALAFRYVFRAAAPPPGIEAMRPGSDFLQLINGRGAEPFRLIALGGRYDFGAPNESAGSAFLGKFAEQLFGGQPNDLVVPEVSALARGIAIGVSGSCAHSDYFDNGDALDVLRREGVIQ